MGKIKGQTEYEKWEKGKELTRKQSILAYCYQCNGFSESNENCNSLEECPLYLYRWGYLLRKRKSGIFPSRKGI